MKKILAQLIVLTLIIQIIPVFALAQLSGTNIFTSQPLGKNVPSVPIDVELSLLEVPKLGQSSQLVCTVSSAFDAPMANVQIKLPEGLALVEGDLSWLGDIPANGMIEVKSVIKAIEVGNWTIEGYARYHFAQDSWYGDSDYLYVWVSQESASIVTPATSNKQTAKRMDSSNLPSLENVTKSYDYTVEPAMPNATANEVNSPGTLTINGRFWVWISDGTPAGNDVFVPLVWATVWIYDQGGNYLTNGITDHDGRFSITLTNPGSFYVLMLTTSVYGSWEYNVTDTGENYYQGWCPNYLTGDPFPAQPDGTFDIGDWSVPDDQKGPWRIYETIVNDYYDHGGWNYYANTLGYIVNSVTVLYPSGSWPQTDVRTGTIYIPDSDINNGYNSRSSDVILHEFSHNAMYDVYGDYFPPNTSGSHSINLVSNPNMAWTEGFANFVPLAIWNDPEFTYVTRYNINLETPTWGTPGWDEGDEVEGHVAGALWDVFDSTDDGYDKFTDGFSNIWNVLSSQIDDTYAEFYSAWRSMGKDRHMLNFCSYQNTIDYNNSPALTDGQIYPLPDPIYPDTELVFWVYYKDDDHDPANIVRIHIYDGGWSYYSMDHDSGDPATGEWFYKPLSGFSSGWHDYFFYAEDGIDEDRDPDSGYYQFYVSPPPQYTITFYTNPVTDPPSITFDGTTYTHGQTGSYSSGDYLATANPPGVDYAFHHWEYSGSPGVGVYVSNININPTTVEVRGNGWLKAVFSAKITFHTSPAGVGSITYDGSTFVDGDDYWEPNLPPDYGNIRTIMANSPIDYTFVSWGATGKIYVSDPSSLSTTLTVEGPGALTANFEAPALADLIVDDIWWVPEGLEARRPFDVYFRIKNEGDVNAVETFNCSILIDGSEYAIVGKDGLGAGDNYTWSIKVDDLFLRYGNHTFTVIVDTDDDVREYDEYNNSLSETCWFSGWFSWGYPLFIIQPEKYNLSRGITYRYSVEFQVGHDENMEFTYGFSPSLDPLVVTWDPPPPIVIPWGEARWVHIDFNITVPLDAPIKEYPTTLWINGSSTYMSISSDHPYDGTIIEGKKRGPFQLIEERSHIFVSAYASPALFGFRVQITGLLTWQHNGSSIPNAPVLLSYRYHPNLTAYIPSEKAWRIISTVITDADGGYSATWFVMSSGYYVLEAFYPGGGNVPEAISSTNLLITSSDDRVFSVSSNSTVSAMSFNSTARELTFTVSGYSGTTGYLHMFLAKSLVPDVSELKISFDGVEKSYEAISVDDTWLIRLTYTHSTHTVRITLSSAPTMPAATAMQVPLSVPFFTVLAAIAIILAVLKYGTYVSRVITESDKRLFLLQSWLAKGKRLMDTLKPFPQKT